MRGHDLSGQRFGRLVAISRTDERYNNSVVWLCRCDCGAEKPINASDLRQQKIRSCGCLHREQSAAQAVRIGRENRRHGHKVAGAETGTYSSWRAMLKRTGDENNKYYGAIGVTVCERWKVFENFLADMGERPEGKTLDRYPNPSGNYEPGNCRWATGSEQRLNRREAFADLGVT